MYCIVHTSLQVRRIQVNDVSQWLHHVERIYRRVCLYTHETWILKEHQLVTSCWTNLPHCVHIHTRNMDTEFQSPVIVTRYKKIRTWDFSRNDEESDWLSNECDTSTFTLSTNYPVLAPWTTLNTTSSVRLNMFWYLRMLGIVRHPETQDGWNSINNY